MIEELLQYYDTHKRPLPWRKNRDPYRIWISEIMCQQTRVDTVIPYFLHFMEVYPDIQSLASADDDELNKCWQGLGYYSRARNLKKAAIQIQEKHSGVFPQNYDDLIALPGIGDYTASAILSMAFDEPYVSIDGNFFRVFSRFYNDNSDIALETTKNKLKEELLKILPKRSGDFNQAVMDLGATICIPNEEPRCERCPLIKECEAYKKKTFLEVPFSSKETKVSEYDYSIFIIRIGDQYVLHKRPDTGLLASLYEFKNTREKLSIEKVKKKFKKAKVQEFPKKTHHFSHQTWTMYPFVIALSEYSLGQDECFATLEEIYSLYSVPKAFNQFFDLLGK